jgi:hypothetical protein
MTLDKALELDDCPAGEQRGHDVLSLFGFCISQEAEGRAVLPKALIEALFFIPSIAVVIDFMICRGVGEVELWSRQDISPT